MYSSFGDSQLCFAKMSLARQVLESVILWSMYAITAAVVCIFVSYYKSKPLLRQTLIDLVTIIV